MAGNANSGQRKDKIIRDALTLAAKRVQEGDPQGRIKLAVACEKVVEAAVNGDLAAFKEMADRIDGKAIQQTEGSIEINLHVDARKRLERKLIHATADAAAANGSAETTH